MDMIHISSHHHSIGKDNLIDLAHTTEGLSHKKLGWFGKRKIYFTLPEDTLLKVSIGRTQNQPVPISAATHDKQNAILVSDKDDFDFLSRNHLITPKDTDLFITKSRITPDQDQREASFKVISQREDNDLSKAIDSIDKEALIQRGLFVKPKESTLACSGCEYRVSANDVKKVTEIDSRSYFRKMVDYFYATSPRTVKAHKAHEIIRDHDRRHSAKKCRALNDQETTLFHRVDSHRGKVEVPHYDSLPTYDGLPTPKYLVLSTKSEGCFKSLSDYYYETSKLKEAFDEAKRALSVTNEDAEVQGLTYATGNLLVDIEPLVKEILFDITLASSNAPNEGKTRKERIKLKLQNLTDIVKSFDKETTERGLSVLLNDNPEEAEEDKKMKSSLKAKSNLHNDLTSALLQPLLRMFSVEELSEDTASRIFGIDHPAVLKRLHAKAAIADLPIGGNPREKHSPRKMSI